VASGTEIVLKTAQTLEAIVTDFENVSKIISQINVDSIEQAESIAHMSGGLVQIAGITQQNSAASEESAAASLELLSLASTLMDLFDER
jgi:methyl-accepting chemotaxis protein